MTRSNGGFMKKVAMGILGFLALASSIFVVSNAQVSSGCDNPKNEFDDHYCFLQRYVQADKDLNTVYKELRNLLDAEGKQLLKTSELRWIKEREKAVVGEISGERVFFMGRAMRRTESRLEFLKARVRECNSTGCVNSKLR
jgi:uncharacterized protein YecT (DUF1311 family)